MLFASIWSTNWFSHVVIGNIHCGFSNFPSTDAIGHYLSLRYAWSYTVQRQQISVSVTSIATNELTHGFDVHTS